MLPSVMRTLALRCVVLGVTLAGCAPLPLRPSAQLARTSRQVRSDDQATIYATVIRYLFDPSVPGGRLRLYIVRSTNDAAADPSTAAPVSVVLPDTVQAAITAALGGFPTQVIWVDKFDDVKVAEDSGAVVGGGVIVQVGNIQRETGTRALVPASIYARERTTGGARYVVEQRAGTWAVTGTRGGFWSTQ